MDKLQELATRPAISFYGDLATKKQEASQQLFGGSKMVAEAFNRRHRAKELTEKVKALPHVVLAYSNEQLTMCKGLVPEIVEIAIIGASLGIPRPDICKMIAVKPQRFNSWLDLGLEGEHPYYSFAALFLQTEAFHDMDIHNDVREALALEMKTVGGYLQLLKRIDEQRSKESGEDEIDLSQLTEDEFDEYSTTGKVPRRLKGNQSGAGDYVEGQVIEEEAFVMNYKLQQQVLVLQQQLAEAEKKAARNNSE